MFLCAFVSARCVSFYSSSCVAVLLLAFAERARECVRLIIRPHGCVESFVECVFRVARGPPPSNAPLYRYQSHRFSNATVRSLSRKLDN